MNELGQVAAEIADREFDGRSYNGPSFMVTLRAASIDQVTSTETLEGYSIYGVALHVLYCKYQMMLALGVDPEPFPFEEVDFPPVPADADVASWERLLELLSDYHARINTAAAALGPDELDVVFPLWRTTRRDLLLWYVTHDTYHTAQIRNMGVPGLEFRAPA